MENKSVFEFLDNGLLHEILKLIEESGMSAAQARDIPRLLEDAINSKNEELLSRSQFSAAINR